MAPALACPVFVLLACGRSTVPACTLDQALQAAGPDDLVPVLVELEPGAEPASLMSPRGGRDRRAAELVSALRASAQSSQGAVLEALRRGGAVDVQPLWIVHAIAARVPPALVRALAKEPSVRAIRLDATLHAPAAAQGTSTAPEWNVQAVHAPAVWGRGFDGSGVVVATMDTGVDALHPDLKDRWRGGTSSWWDPYRGTAAPYDVNGHGTQTMGVLVGGSAGGTAIGMAPGARWIAAKVYDDSGNTTVSTLHQAFQWLLEPSGDPDAPGIPDVVNASWGLDSVGVCDTTFEPDLQALQAAGVVAVFAAGNYGPGPGTGVSPANEAEGFAVGAVDESLTVDRSSSRGPSACTTRPFPDLVAPGVNVRTADRTLAGMPRFSQVSGTSVAAPHVAGIAALLRGAFPGSAVAQIEDTLRATALDLGTPGPDDATGTGLVDAEAAYLSLGGATPLHIATALLPPVSLAVPYSAQLRAVGGIAPYTWSLGGGTLPPGLGLASNGLLTGTATQLGDYVVTVAVQATSGAPVEQALTLSVTPSALTIVNSALSPGRVGDAYAQPLTAVGGRPPYAWTLSLVSCTVALPPGLALDRASGLISGTPTSRGTFGFVARVSDAALGAASRAFSLSIQ